MTEAFVWDYKTEKERWTSASETSEILEEIRHEFVKDDGAIQYSHKVGVHCTDHGGSGCTNCAVPSERPFDHVR